MGNFKKMILGEEMPDKDDPKYKEKYEKMFAEMLEKAKQIIGVEVIPEAIENAKENAARNGIYNTEFIFVTFLKINMVFYVYNNLIDFLYFIFL